MPRKLCLIAALVCVLGACGGGSQTTASDNPGSGSAGAGNSGGSGSSGGSGGTGSSGSSAVPTQPTDITTFKYDVGRSGQNLT
ncbi:MAG TPA: hypothetical protein VI653_19925, partial [Steroidobacteraceae bacterium]